MKSSPMGWWLASILLLSSCTTLPGEPSPATRFYLLSAQEPVGEATGVSFGKDVVEIVSVELAPYLHRPQIVTRQADHRLQLADYDQWGEELPDGIARVLEANLTVILGGERVRRADSQYLGKDTRRLYFRINRFERDEQGRVVLAVYWTMRGADGAELLARRWSQKGEAVVADDDYGGIVAAMNQLLKQLSQEVAALMGP